MRFEYELGEDDLLLRALGARRNARLRKSPALFVFAVAAAGAIGWPIWGLLAAGQPALSGTPGTVVCGFAVLIAAGVVFVLRPRLPFPKYARLRDYAARKKLGRSLAQSVLGPVSVEVTAAGLLRTNASGVLEVPFGKVEALLELGRAPEALAALERGAGVLQTTQLPPEVGARLRYLLARALLDARGDAVRAAALAQSARAELPPRPTDPALPAAMDALLQRLGVKAAPAAPR